MSRFFDRCCTTNAMISGETDKVSKEKMCRTVFIMFAMVMESKSNIVALEWQE
jgi:hypothetical protein